MGEDSGASGVLDNTVGLFQKRAKVPKRSKGGAPALKVRETIGIPDPDFFLPGHQNFRRTAGRAIRTVPDSERRRSLRHAFDEHRQNPIANRILAIKADFIVGAGIMPISENEDLSKFLTSFWEDKVNRFPQQLHKLAVGFRRDGELIAEPLVNTVTGRTRLLWNDPAIIVEVVPHTKFYTEPAKIRWGLTGVGGDNEAYIVAPGEAEHTWTELQAMKKEAVLYFRANESVGDLRGLSDLHHSWEYLTALDNASFAMLERIIVSISYIWMVKGKGMSGPEIDDILATLRTAKPGESMYLRGDTTIEPLIPELKGAEFAEVFRTFKNIILGGSATPEGWFADADSANRAALTAQGDPTFRAMSRSQNEFVTVLRTCVDFAIERAVEAGILSAEAAAAGYELSTDPINQKDDNLIVDLLVKLTQVLDYAVEIAGSMTQKEAAVIFRQKISEITDIGEELPDELVKEFEATARPRIPAKPLTGGQEVEEAEVSDSFRAAYRNFRDEKKKKGAA